MRRIAFVLLTLVASCTQVLAQSVGLEVFSQAVEMNFPQGYDVYSDAGKLLKTVPGPTSATVHAKTSAKTFAVGEVYLSDWSYERMQKGDRPNWIVPKENDTAAAATQVDASSGASAGLIAYPAIKEVTFPVGYSVFSDDGELIKTVPGPTSIALKGETGGKPFANGTAYLSDWSYDQMQQGNKPNWVVSSNSLYSGNDTTSVASYKRALNLADDPALKSSVSGYLDCLRLLSSAALEGLQAAKLALREDTRVIRWHENIYKQTLIAFPLSAQELMGYEPYGWRIPQAQSSTRHPDQQQSDALRCFELYAAINLTEQWPMPSAASGDASQKLLLGSGWVKLGEGELKDLETWATALESCYGAIIKPSDRSTVLVNIYAGLTAQEEVVGTKFIARAYGNKVAIFDKKSGVLWQAFDLDFLADRGRIRGGRAKRMVFSADEKMLAFGSSSGMGHYEMYIYNIPTGTLATVDGRCAYLSIFARGADGKLTLFRPDEVGVKDANVTWDLERSEDKIVSQKQVCSTFLGQQMPTQGVTGYEPILQAWMDDDRDASQAYSRTQSHKQASDVGNDTEAEDRLYEARKVQRIDAISSINESKKLNPKQKERYILEHNLGIDAPDNWTAPCGSSPNVWLSSLPVDKDGQPFQAGRNIGPVKESDLGPLGPWIYDRGGGWSRYEQAIWEMPRFENKMVRYDLNCMRWSYDIRSPATPSTLRTQFFNQWHDLDRDGLSPSLAWRRHVLGYLERNGYRSFQTHNREEWLPRKYETPDGNLSVYTIFSEKAVGQYMQSIAVQQAKKKCWIALPDLTQDISVAQATMQSPSVVSQHVPFILPKYLSTADRSERQHYYDATSKTLYLASEDCGLFEVKTQEPARVKLLPAIKVYGNFAVSGDRVFDGKSLWSLDKCEKIVDVILGSGGDLCLVTPDLFYGGPAASQWISFRQADRAYPFEQFDLRLNRPDIVLERLGAPADAVAIAKQLRDKRLKRMGVTEEMLKTDFHVPELEIVGDVPSTTDAGEINLAIKASDSKYPLERLKVYVNNVPVNGRDGELLREESKSAGSLLGRITEAFAGSAVGPQSLERTIPIKLAAGRNKIQVSVLNNAGAESLYANAEINCTAQRPKPTLYALAMGVSEYSNADWNLKYAAKDARDVLARLKDKAGDQYGEVKELLLTDKDVTKENLAKVREFLKGATIDDTVLMFAAGHGLLDSKYDYYFGTTDIDFNNPSEKGIAFEEFDDILADLPCLKKSLLVDTCHAGELDQDEKALLASADSGGSAALPTGKGIAMRSIGTRGMNVKAIEGARGASEWYDRLQGLFVDLRRGSGSTILTSAAGAEYALESSEQQNGLFTYAVLEALDGKPDADTNKDGSVQVSELGEYVKKRVSDLTNNKQTPNTRRVNLESDFTLAKTK